MKKPTSWTDRLEIEDKTLYRILRAELNSKKCYYEIDVYKENDLGETFCQNLYSSSWGGYVVAFPGLPMNPNKNSWYYNNNIAEEDGFAECKKCNVGTSRSVTESDLKLVKVIKKIEKKYGFKDTEIDGYHIFVSASLDVWEKQADCLHQCILKAGYRDKMFNQKSVIVFIQKNGTPQATAEISNDGKKIIQFYADEFDRNNCLPSEEIKAAFQKWLNLKKPRNQSKKQKEVA